MAKAGQLMIKTQHMPQLVKEAKKLLESVSALETAVRANDWKDRKSPAT